MVESHLSLLTAWASIAAGFLALLIHEVRFRYRSRRNPMRYARTAHARMRAEWVRSLMSRPGNEILAVQTLRNSVMSSTITGSTAALALMGTVSLASSKLNFTLVEAGSLTFLFNPTPRALLLALLIGILFATFVLSVMAVRFYNHAGYMITTVSEERRGLLARPAELYIIRAGNYYSMSMRTFLWIAPLAAGLINPILVPPAAVALIWVLVWYDRTPQDIWTSST